MRPGLSVVFAGLNGFANTFAALCFDGRMGGVRLVAWSSLASASAGSSPSGTEESSMPIGILGTNLWNLFLYRRGVSNPFIPCIPPNPDFRDLSAKRKFLAARFHRR